MDTFSEAKYSLNVNFLISFDHNIASFNHHSNIIVAALGLDDVMPSENSG